MQSSSATEQQHCVERLNKSTTTKTMHSQQQPPRQPPRPGQQVDPIQTYMSSVEPDQAKLEQDLAQLAAYMVKIGTDVNIGRRKYCRPRVQTHPELDADLLQEIIVKYKLTYRHKCERLKFDQDTNRSLFHIAQSYTALFLEGAARLSPGTYSERRFWWCAGNFGFFERQQQHQLAASAAAAADKKPLGDAANRVNVGGCNPPSLLLSGGSGKPPARENAQKDPSNAAAGGDLPAASNLLRSSLVMSDVLCNVLSTDEPKMIVLNALHLSVKYSNFRVHLDWFKRNRAWIFHQIAYNHFHQNNPRAWLQLRRAYRIQEFERSLCKVDVDRFIERWNLTGLRPPDVKEYLHSFCELIKA